MKRKSNDDDGGALDSLLDTMTNVVGILVIVLVVTQLGVGDAVDRISETQKIDPEEMKKKQEKLAEAKLRKKQLSEELSDVKPLDSKQLADRLQALQKDLAGRQQQLTQIKKDSEKTKKKLQQDQKKATDAKKENEKNKKEREKLNKELDQALEQLAKLEALLDKTPERKQLPPKAVNLPNPRPAPEGAKPITLLCTNNKVYPVDITTFQQTAQKRAAFIVRSKRLDREPAKGIDAEKFAKEFGKSALRDDYFEAKLTVSGGRYPRLVFNPKPNAGATVKEVESPRSRFQRDLQRVDKTKFYARFYVCADSYDVYLSARKVAVKYGLLAGWDPQPTGWKYSVSMGGPLRLGPPPKPNPNPPKPAPKPAKPKKPANVID